MCNKTNKGQKYWPTPLKFTVSSRCPLEQLEPKLEWRGEEEEPVVDLQHVLAYGRGTGFILFKKRIIWNKKKHRKIQFLLLSPQKCDFQSKWQSFLEVLCSVCFLMAAARCIMLLLSCCPGGRNRYQISTQHRLLSYVLRQRFSRCPDPAIVLVSFASTSLS